MNVTVGNLFYGTEGWMSMNDAGYQIYKGESSELNERREARAPARTRPRCTWRISWPPSDRAICSELHDPLSNAFLSASLCHLANISYRTGHKLNLEAGPKFTGDAAANRLLTRDAYRKGYVV